MTVPPKKPGLMAQAKAGKTPAAPASQTESFDNFKKKQLLKQAEAELQIRPESKTAKQQLDQAINVEYAYKRYRETLKLARDKGAKAEEARLKQLKALLDEDVAASREVPASLDALLDACDEIKSKLK